MGGSCCGHNHIPKDITEEADSVIEVIRRNSYESKYTLSGNLKVSHTILATTLNTYEKQTDLKLDSQISIEPQQATPEQPKNHKKKSSNKNFRIPERDFLSKSSWTSEEETQNLKGRFLVDDFLEHNKFV